ncbi:hypothetical protein ACFQ0M_04025 [Kitasatospora aburaviensis]
MIDTGRQHGKRPITGQAAERHDGNAEGQEAAPARRTTPAGALAMGHPVGAGPQPGVQPVLTAVTLEEPRQLRDLGRRDVVQHRPRLSVEGPGGGLGVGADHLEVHRVADVVGHGRIIDAQLLGVDPGRRAVRAPHTEVAPSMITRSPDGHVIGPSSKISSIARSL